MRPLGIPPPSLPILGGASSCLCPKPDQGAIRVNSTRFISALWCSLRSVVLNSAHVLEVLYMKTEAEVRAFLGKTEGNAPFGYEHNKGVQDALRWVLDED